MVAGQTDYELFGLLVSGGRMQENSLHMFFLIVLRKKVSTKNSCSCAPALCVFTQTKMSEASCNNRMQLSKIFWFFAHLNGAKVAPLYRLVSAHTTLSSAVIQQKETWARVGIISYLMLQEACEEKSDRGEKRLMSVRWLKPVPPLCIE